MNDILTFLAKVFEFDDSKPFLFTQFYFWVFFAFVMAALSFLQKRKLLRNTFLCFVSFFFYYRTSGLFTLILLFITVYDYWAGARISAAKTKKSKQWWVAISIFVNLLTLSYFKYAYFITDIVNQLFNTQFAVFDFFSYLGNMVSGEARFRVDMILLPVGISFYIFQAISYLMDTYKNRVAPVTNLLDFAFYVSFFPSLVAGPIIRAEQFIPQINKPYQLSRKHFGLAVFWILNGLTKKIILSDYIAVNFIDRVFENPMLFTGFENLVALFGYSLQVYADFSGYTDIAIGVALLMGFHVPKNFDSPYKATNAGNFWKRWHISLSKLLQDYLYIPLGGNRKATFGTYATIISIALIAALLTGSWWVAAGMLMVATLLMLIARFKPGQRKNMTTDINLMNTMLLGGLWHGASWNFMIWGGLNGIGIIAYKIWRKWSINQKTLIIFLITASLWVLNLRLHIPVLNIAIVWSLAILAGMIFRQLSSFMGNTRQFPVADRAWAIAQTFVFITFTRLFFRSGSNLDPAIANEVAWNTARNMVNQIGTTWNTAIIPQIMYEYRYVFILIVTGMIIHWLPDNFKRRYRIWFAKMPVGVMAVVVVVVVFVLYQFITSDLQKFIYFQF